MLWQLSMKQHAKVVYTAVDCNDPVDLVAGDEAGKFLHLCEVKG